jgi:hypothetical protein
MAVVVGPLHSDEAHGTYTGQLVYCLRHGRTYVRTRVVPANPRTTRQQAHRAVIREAAAAWRALSPATRALWNERARGTNMNGYALFVKTRCDTTAG